MDIMTGIVIVAALITATTLILHFFPQKSEPEPEDLLEARAKLEAEEHIRETLEGHLEARETELRRLQDKFVEVCASKVSK